MLSGTVYLNKNENVLALTNHNGYKYIDQV